MTEGTSGTAPGSILRGVESGASLTEGTAYSVDYLPDEALTRFVMASSQRTPVTVPGR